MSELAISFDWDLLNGMLKDSGQIFLLFYQESYYSSYNQYQTT